MIKRNLGPLQFPDELLNFIRNPKIGLRAKGLLLHMLVQEDNFELNTKDLCIYNKDNPSIVNGAIKDLEKLGYIEVLNKDTPEMSYVIYDSPQVQVSTKFREQERLKKAADNATIAADIKRKLLVRLNGMVDAFPDNAATEVRDLNKEYQRIYKLRDLAAAYKDLTADMVTAENADIEDLTPLMELLR